MGTGGELNAVKSSGMATGAGAAQDASEEAKVCSIVNPEFVAVQ